MNADLVDVISAMLRALELLARTESSQVTGAVAMARARLDAYRATRPPAS